MRSHEQLAQELLLRTRDAVRFSEPIEATAALAREAGVPLERVYVGTVTLHPQTFAFGVFWTLTGGCREARFPHQRMTSLLSQDSPMRRMIRQGQEQFRGRIASEGDQGLHDLTQLAAEGYTDVVGWVVRWHGLPGAAITYATKDPAGFSEEHLGALRALHLVTEARLAPIASHQTMGDLLTTYLGAQSGERVLLGEVKRGDGQTIRAALWFSDIRGFSTLSEELPRDELLLFLNDAFELQVDAIQREGGQVLKFIGDGLLAIFQVNAGDEASACERALRAALQVRAALRERNVSRAQRGHQAMRIGVALHLGDVMYGNIGGLDRLDFTVIGPAVNRAARIEAACSKLGYDVLASAELAARVTTPLELVGRVELKGIGGLHEVFTPRA